MRSSSLPTSHASAAVWLVAFVWVAGEVTGGYRLERPGALLVGVAVVALGEILEVDLRGGRSTPVSGAAIFALFAILEPIDIVPVLVPAFLVALPFRARRLGWGPPFRSSSRRLATTMITLTVYRVLIVPSSWLGSPRAVLAADVGLMVVAGVLYLVLDTAASAYLISRAQAIPLAPIWRGQIRNRLPLDAALLSIAALMALAYVALGAASFLLFLLPLLAARDSFRRYASIHKTYIQTIRALSRVPELAGYAPEGHAVGVAELARDLARAVGLSDTEVEEVEFAGLLHDVGRISFDDPSEIPESVAGTHEGSRLARESAAIVAQTPYLSRVAEIVGNQDAAFQGGTAAVVPGILPGSRILRVANAFVELTEQAGPGVPPLVALHQIEIGAGTAYDPRIVTALRRVLEWQGRI